MEQKQKQRARSEIKCGSVGGWGRERKLGGRQETVLIQWSEWLQNGYLGIVLAERPHKDSD